MELNKYIGTKIKYFREDRSLTQDDLAEKLNTTRQSVSRYENGERKANQDLLFRLASIFNVKVDEFFPPRQTARTFGNGKTGVMINAMYNMYNGSVAAGLPDTIDAVFEDELDKIAVPDYLMNGYAGNKDILFMRVNGDSMNNVIPHGSLVGIKNWDINNLKNNDIVVFSDNGEFSMKRYIKDDKNNRIIFRPDSSDENFSDLTFNIDDAVDLKILGKIIVSIINYD